MLDTAMYFIITDSRTDKIRQSDIADRHISIPALVDENDKESLEFKQWNFYNNWLASTIGKSLLILEFGVSFSNPNLIRWPFERICMINNRAKMIRINAEFEQISAEIAGKAIGIKENPHNWLCNFLQNLEITA